MLCLYEGLFVYLDYILVFDQTEEEHDCNFLALLRQIEQLGLMLSPEKCVYRQLEITFLGHPSGAGAIFR